MDQDPGELTAQQQSILTACNQPKITNFTWPENFQVDDDNAPRKEIMYTIGNYWAQHARQLSTFMNTLRADLKTSVNRMMANPDSWETSRHAAGIKINAEATNLKCAMERFITHMTCITLETLGLQEPRTRARVANHEENLAELESQLMESQVAVSNNLDSVSTQIELLNDAISSYNHLNPPADVEAQPQATDGDQRPPAAASGSKYDPKESFLGPQR